MDSEKSINLLKIKEIIGHLLIYGHIIFFLQFANNFATLLLCKIYVYGTFNEADLFFFLYMTQ